MCIRIDMCLYVTLISVSVRFTCQVKQMVNSGGLGQWMFKPYAKEWKLPAIQWPHMNIAIDQGSDGLSAMWWLFMMLLCATFWLDFSHGAWRSVQGMINDVGLEPWWLLMMVMFNCAHGPWNSDSVFNSIQECWKELKKHCTPEDLPLFIENVANMIEDLGAEGRGMGTNMTRAMPDQCIEEPPLKERGTRPT